MTLFGRLTRYLRRTPFEVRLLRERDRARNAGDILARSVLHDLSESKSVPLAAAVARYALEEGWTPAIQQLKALDLWVPALKYLHETRYHLGKDLMKVLTQE